MSRRILITGATRGLGDALAREFVRLGHTVLGCGTTEDGVARLQRELGEPNHFAVVDVADDAAVSRWAARVMERCGVPDLLLNNAGVIHEPAPLWEIGAEEFSRLVDVNLEGVVSVIRHFAPAMVQRGSGVIVNFSSGWGRSAAAGVAPYCATKWALEGLTRALAQELPDGMAAVSLNPGVIHTDMLEIAFGREDAARCVAPGDWSRTAVPFLLGIGAAQNGAALSAP